MLTSLPTSLGNAGLLDTVRSAPPIVYLALAAVSLLVALRIMRALRKAFMPLGALLQAAAGIAVVSVAVVLALVLVAAAALSAQ
ncbi:hypothetical protein Aab01nite_38950 [Paractinoplanes abujensis]|uniref:Uncharacterized protein n=1 Tax=Paractinoplanes abujensis TaxID=882441 RepID=A0A7W7G526_9ACTN|nr:hypothetical protein [Actinoplanes abujensis]MBB4694481.1 hypothetical protein [Actinoplanes abujensis]GID20305.1 hypothetical protein Aab01nite_38950 [Actinoplanes abujensis]